jgi:hypothetical protein
LKNVLVFFSVVLTMRTNNRISAVHYLARTEAGIPVCRPNFGRCFGSGRPFSTQHMIYTTGRFEKRPPTVTVSYCLCLHIQSNKIKRKNTLYIYTKLCSFLKRVGAEAGAASKFSSKLDKKKIMRLRYTLLTAQVFIHLTKRSNGERGS